MDGDRATASSPARPRVLFFFGPGNFTLDHGYRRANHLELGPAALCSALDPERYEVDFFDLDAHLIRRRGRVDPASRARALLDDEASLMAYLDRRDEPELEAIVGDRPPGMTGPYDYIFCSSPSTSKHRNVAPSVYLTYLVLLALRAESPGARIVWGGRKLMMFNFRPLLDGDGRFRRVVNLVVDGPRIPYQRLALLAGPEMEAAYADETTTFVAELPTEVHRRLVLDPQQIATAEDGLVPQPFIRKLENVSDHRYTYGQIFELYGCAVPDARAAKRSLAISSVYSSFGCAGNCAFCEDSAPYRPLARDSLFDTIKRLVQELGYDTLMFYDAAINSSLAHAEQLCNFLAREGLDIRWSCSARLSRRSRSPELFAMARETGCTIACFGCESGSPAYLERVNKGITVAEMEEGLAQAHQAGIWTIGNFIIGIPFETDAMVEETIRFVGRNRPHLDGLVFHPFKMLEGSPFAQHPDRHGIIFTRRRERPAASNVGYADLVKTPMEYEERGGREWPDVLAFRQRSIARIEEVFRHDPRHRFGEPAQHLLFALLDIFDDPTAVHHWLDRELTDAVGRHGGPGSA